MIAILILVLGFDSNAFVECDLYNVMRTLGRKIGALHNVSLRFLVDEGTSDEIIEALLKYDQQTKDEAASFRIHKAVDEETVIRKAERASIVFFSDLHGISEIQERARETFEILDETNDREKIFIAEFVYSKYQNYLDDFMKGLLTTDELHDLIHFDGTFDPSWWPEYAKILEMLKERKATVLAAFYGDENSNWADIVTRDTYVVELVQKHLERNPEAQVFLLHGQSHLVGKTHIQDQLEEIFPKKTITLLTALSQVHWTALRQGFKMDRSLFLSLRGGNRNTFYFHTISPTITDTYGIALVNAIAESKQQPILNEQYQEIVGTYNEITQLLEEGNTIDARSSLEVLTSQLNEWMVLVTAPCALRREIFKAAKSAFSSLREFLKEFEIDGEKVHRKIT